MQIILYLSVAALLVLGQSFWKLGITQLQPQLTGQTQLVKKLFALFINPYVIAGFVVYIFATALYMYVLSKYQYGVSYVVIVSLSIVFATIIAMVLFKEQIRLINAVGLAIIIAGVILVAKK